MVVALTAQNTTGVQAVHSCGPQFIEQQASALPYMAMTQVLTLPACQLHSVLDDVEIKAMKTGMLFDAASIRAVVGTLKAHYASKAMPPLVCDPVCVSTSGHTLLQPDAVEVMISELFPVTYLVTPNKSEAELLLSTRGLPATIGTLEEMLDAAKNLHTLGPQAVLLKGGHLTVTIADIDRVSAAQSGLHVVRDGLFEENMEILQLAEGESSEARIVVDVLHTTGSTTLYIRPRIESTSTHGTGCTLSAAVVCGLSRGEDG